MTYVVIDPPSQVPEEDIQFERRTLYGDAELRKIIAVRMSPVRIFAPGLLFPEVSLGQCTSRCGLCCGDETTVYR